MHQFTCEAGHGNMTVMISRFLFGRVALNTKAGVRAPIENRNHPVCIIRVSPATVPHGNVHRSDFFVLLFAAAYRKKGPPAASRRFSLSENRNRLTAHTCDVRFWHKADM